MVRSETAFPGHDLLCNCLKEFWQECVFDEYSENHILIKAIEQDNEYFRKFAIRKGYRCTLSEDFGFNFTVNLNSRISFLCSHFGKDKISLFLRNQFAAGKNNYSEALFFQALAEVHVLAHFLAFTKHVLSAEYEPTLVESSKHNPEARIIYQDNLILDIEVKTPDFQHRNIIENCLYPATLLTDTGIAELMDYCKSNNITLKLPRVLKIKDYIKYAGEKFVNITSEKHLNILFINWTYTDVYENPLFEPISLLCNPDNGILINCISHKLLGIDETDLQKISAFFIYTIPEETLLFGDFRYLFRDRCYKIIINPFATRNSADIIHELTGMAVHFPYELSKNLTAFFNFDDRLWDTELREIQRIISENTLR